MANTDFIKDLKFDDRGLIPAVAQDAVSGEILMLAYMNEESIKLTLETGHATYFSRSRQELWEKGAHSGHLQLVKEMLVDCDQDAIVLKIEQIGAACHTGNISCFYRKVVDGKLVEIPTGIDTNPKILYDVYNIIVDRVKHPKEGSYTNYLFEKGIDKMLKKIGEESAEVIIASKNYVKSEVQYETADLLYHLAVVLVEEGLTWDDVFAELRSRYNK
ncbi:MAG: bifunctional phosphoribosyl-AMP cyclohydrolase/phosphoribosyl-ATP diphosphatase HisIE [Clostridiales bacterium]|nr:bifunctional phosphoribosyl-AMP cyclohydrolase/phosphoribosyl-ATP diphosphatase HisIE [Clostridiales bacterium]